MGDYWGDDGYDYYGRPRRRPSPHHMRSDRDGLLSPGLGSQNLYRSRSQGHGPAPQINVYNRMYQDQQSSRSPSPLPYPQYPPYPASSGSRRASPRSSQVGRGRSHSRGLGDRLGANLADELAEMALEHRFRSRSRGRSDASAFDRPPSGYAEWQLAQREAQLRDLSREKRWREEEENIRRRLKLEQMEAELKRDKDDDERKDREKRILEDAERKAREAREKKEAAEKAAVAEWERRRAEDAQKAKDAEQRLREKMEREAKEAKEKEQKAYEDFKRKEQEKKDKEKHEWEDFERRRKEKLEKEKKEKEEAEEKFQSEMRKRLRDLGYTERTIDIMVDEEKAKKFKKEVNEPVRVRDNRLELFQPARGPVYPKVHKNYLAVETLKYYDLPWEYDRSDPDYIIILRDMEKRETDVLFEHTSRLRAGKLLLEAPKEKKQFAMYRKRSRSRHGAKEIGVLRLA